MCVFCNHPHHTYELCVLDPVEDATPSSPVETVEVVPFEEVDYFRTLDLKYEYEAEVNAERDGILASREYLREQSAAY